MARAYPFTASGQLVTGPGELAGLVVEETAAAAAAVRLYDGTDNTGVLLDAVRVAASLSEQHSHASPVFFATGLYAEKVTGTVKAVAHVV